MRKKSIAVDSQVTFEYYYKLAHIESQVSSFPGQTF